jgi:hypothetical protein
MNSYTQTETFTVTHARHIASKVAADLLRFRRFYGHPPINEINEYEEELVALLKDDYLDEVTYGFKRNGQWVEALKYHALPGGRLVNDDPGKIRPGVDVSNASFTSFLSRNSRWDNLSVDEKASFKAKLTLKRGYGQEPKLESGSWSTNSTYSAGGQGIGRSTITR